MGHQAKAGITRTFVVKLFPSPEQKVELVEFLKEWRKGLNFAIRRIEEEYRQVMSEHKQIEETGTCSECGSKDASLRWVHIPTEVKLCGKCFNRKISEYTMKKRVVSSKDRSLPSDKDVRKSCNLIHGTHYDNLVSQAYGIWRSYNGWRKRRQRELKSLTQKVYSRVPNARKVHNVWFNRLRRPVLETCAMCGRGGRYRWLSQSGDEALCDDCFEDFSSVRRELKRVKQFLRDVSFPVVESYVARIDKSFFKFLEDGHVKIKLLRKEKHRIPHSLYKKGRGRNKVRRMERLKAFIQKASEQRKRVTLYMRNGDFYISFPLKWRQSVPVIVDYPDIPKVYVTFLPHSICVFHEDSGRIKAKFFHKLRSVLNRREHFQSKRRQLMRKYHELRNKYSNDDFWVDMFIKLCEEGGLSYAKRKVRAQQRLVILKMYDLLSHPILKKERKYSWYHSHAITREIVDYIKGLGYSCVVLVDYKNVLNLRLSPELNRLLRQWAPKDIQDKLVHKLMIEGIPYVLVPYRDIKRVSCLRCGERSENSTIVMSMRNKEFLCSKCGYQVNFHFALFTSLRTWMTENFI